MGKITIQEIDHDTLDVCRDLCNDLMHYQAGKSHFRTDVLQEMTFENRLKPSFENAQIKKLLVAFDHEKPIAYVYADVSDVTEDQRYYVPGWAKNIYQKEHLIFFPDEQKLPARLGTFNNIYIKPEYHGLGLGYQLSTEVIEWMKSIDGITGIYVYVSNGNEQVVDFYKKFGFRFSHNVLGEFITAYYKKV